ncbi:MAG: hypothetical protein IJU40_00155 [Desulfovibrionaceae bacterium]|nr:hypothetical protein [Desulfovibrionaceae bacterium]
MNISELLKILACPKCHSQLELKIKDDTPTGFLCPQCQVVYPIRDDIPIMIIDEAIPKEVFEKDN